MGGLKGLAYPDPSAQETIKLGARQPKQFTRRFFGDLHAQLRGAARRFVQLPMHLLASYALRQIVH